jgi:hypothetical protein
VEKGAIRVAVGTLVKVDAIVSGTNYGEGSATCIGKQIGLPLHAHAERTNFLERENG